MLKRKKEFQDLTKTKEDHVYHDLSYGMEYRKMKRTLLERLDQGPVICAEGFLFEIEKRGYMASGEFVPMVSLEHPEALENLHKDFQHAGSYIVEAFTYNGHREKMRVIGKEELIEPLNRAALKVARKVADLTEHVMLIGEGAEKFAEQIGEEIVSKDYFYSEKNLKRLRKAKNKSTNLNLIQDKIGTVGAVAIDKYGNIAAATSTGGMTNKMPGRVGDSPIIGSGTWAQNNVCGVSSTGHGEFFIKYQVAKEVCTRIEYLNKSIVEASQEIIDELEQIEAYGGIIAIDYDANITMPFNTDGMIRGGITNKRKIFVEIY